MHLMEQPRVEATGPAGRQQPPARAASRVRDDTPLAIRPADRHPLVWTRSVDWILRKPTVRTPQPRTTTKQSIDSYPTPDSMRSRIRSDAVRS